MSAEQKARALMTRHQHSVKNRQQTMLNRAAGEMGHDLDNAQDKPQPKN
ncbi:MAG: hypothetical protein N5P05_001074 [Chroococcopsis gigantea SAG 12.99]|jgi:hypothetical protein|nr:hypothetical protein [Chlorogloea purpurea SAG 13.99]MDV2999468.1 hypothetical protein [Chroococcopsis gigantea SAG 12.99]